MKQIKIPEKGLPVDRNGEPVPLPPWMTMDDAKNGAQLAELALRDHQRNQRERRRWRRRRLF